MLANVLGELWRSAARSASSSIAGVAAVIAALAAASAPAPAEAQSARPDLVGSKFGERRAYFRDWLASCRPGGYCSALTYAGASGDFFDYSVRVGAPEPGLDREILFTAVQAFADPSTTLAVAIDGADIARLEAGADNGWGREPGDAINEHRFGQARANLEILPAMEAGARMTVTFTPDGGAAPRTVAFSLMGLRGALGWIERNRME